MARRAALVLMFLVIAAGSARAETPPKKNGKTVIGQVEEVLLLPWKVKVPARVDTGAARSSLDARDIEFGDDTVTFRLAPAYGGATVTLPLVTTAHYRTSEGGDDRPVVRVDLCVGARRMRILVSLNDRSGMRYPFLLGRKVLARHFLVDVSRRNTLVPSCVLSSALEPEDK